MTGKAPARKSARKSAKKSARKTVKKPARKAGKTPGKANVRLKRAYDEPAAADGKRILVDRLWPRGVKKDAAAIDQWAKDIAPSDALRTWFGHDPARWSEFRRRYIAELRGHAAELDELRALAKRGPVTLVYGARDEEHNQAVVIRDLLAGSD
jgi:uncharacterized protein YeaO (DUF488 family)